MYKTVIYGFIRAVYTMRGCAVVVLGPKPQIKGQKNEKWSSMTIVHHHPVQKKGEDEGKHSYHQ